MRRNIRTLFIVAVGLLTLAIIVGLSSYYVSQVNKQGSTEEEIDYIDDTSNFNIEPRSFKDAQTGLTIEEYRFEDFSGDYTGEIKFGDVFPSDRFAEYMEIMSDCKTLDKRSGFKKQSSAQRRSGDQVVEQLKHLGYGLEETDDGLSTFSRDGDIIVDRIYSIDCFMKNEENEFIFTALQKDPVDDDISTILIRSGQMSNLTSSSCIECPVLIGDSVVWIEYKSSNQEFSEIVDGSVEVPTTNRVVKRDGHEIYHFTTRWRVCYETGSLQGLGEGWVLEYQDHLVIDGVDIGSENNWEKVFGFQMIDGKQFYFYQEQDGSIRISYDGKRLPVSYQYVVHYECCEAGFLNLRKNDRMVWFNAVKDDGFVYHVEVGVFDE